MSENVKRVDKPWGYELHWAKTDRYVGKLIHVDAGHALSLQYHNQKDETIFLWSGRMLFEIQEDGKLVAREMKIGESVHITPGTVHRMTAIDDCDIFEVSTPELDDVVRLEDRYGRTDVTRPERPRQWPAAGAGGRRIRRSCAAAAIAGAAIPARRAGRSRQTPVMTGAAGVAALLKGSIAWAV